MSVVEGITGGSELLGKGAGHYTECAPVPGDINMDVADIIVHGGRRREAIIDGGDS